MAKTSKISVRIDLDLKSSVEQMFNQLGLSTTQAITLFFEQVELQQGLSFLVKIPDDVTMSALNEARARYDLEDFNTAEDLHNDLGI